jgi:pyruvate formate lyase activating enzyme
MHELTNMSDSICGTIFNIQGYSIHDGPGIRTTVFLKGCPLRCLWCQNPESHSPAPELLFSSEKCAACGKCIQACPEGAAYIYGKTSATDRSRCKGAGACAKVCPNEARTMIGRRVTADEVFQEVSADSIFYRDSGGGVTLSGGEPLAQPEFAISILEKCKSAGFHTVLDTCGYSPWPVLEDVLRHVDLVLYDFKHMDAAEHRKITGVPNDLILENARRIHNDLAKPMLARIPLIPGLNDSPENLRNTARFISEELCTAVPVHILPYHGLGKAKWERLDRQSETTSIPIPEEQHAADCLKIFKSFGLSAVVGG